VEAVIASVADSVAGKFQRSLDFYLAASSDASITKIYLWRWLGQGARFCSAR